VKQTISGIGTTIDSLSGEMQRLEREFYQALALHTAAVSNETRHNVDQLREREDVAL